LRIGERARAKSKQPIAVMLTGNLSRIDSLRSDYDKLSIKYATLESDYATLKRALEKGEVIAKSAI